MMSKAAGVAFIFAMRSDFVAFVGKETFALERIAFNSATLSDLL
jgi:hypothetical protein